MKIIERNPLDVIGVFYGKTLTIEYHFKTKEEALDFKLPKLIKDKGYELLDNLQERAKTDTESLNKSNPAIDTYYRIAQLI